MPFGYGALVHLHPTPQEANRRREPSRGFCVGWRGGGARPHPTPANLEPRTEPSHALRFSRFQEPGGCGGWGWRARPHPPVPRGTSLFLDSMARSTFSTAFCKVERRPSNQTVSSTASHRPSNIPFAWFILFERNRQAWADVQTNQAKWEWREGRGGEARAPPYPPFGSTLTTSSDMQ